MKKIIVLSFITLSFLNIHGQSQSMDTLYVNDQQVVSLSFVEPIQKGLTGSPHFTFSYNREHSENLGLLQAEEARESNLLVRTTAGNLYSFVLAFRENLPQLHYFISPEQCLKDPSHHSSNTPLVQDSIQKTKAAEKTNYTLFCQQLLRKKSSTPRIIGKKGIRVKLVERVYHADEVFVLFEIKNRSSVPYELGQFQMAKVLGTPKRKASYQELPITPLFAFQMPDHIDSGSSIRFVVVYPKFTLNSEERLQLKILESQGSRNLTLKLH